MFSIKSIFRQIKEFLLSGMCSFFGILVITIPYSMYDVLFGSKGADIGGFWSIIFSIFVSLLIIGCVMFFDLLIIRFLLRKNFSYSTYFIVGIVVGVLFFGTVGYFTYFL